jgi:hypothetical protein
MATDETAKKICDFAVTESTERVFSTRTTYHEGNTVFDSAPVKASGNRRV